MICANIVSGQSQYRQILNAAISVSYQKTTYQNSWINNLCSSTWSHSYVAEIYPDNDLTIWTFSLVSTNKFPLMFARTPLSHISIIMSSHKKQ